ncbi:hypothetical protein OF83DRAFT_1219078 [Amylostereum chailletii]|nr:hypothetical protein OF83DRAFT_1219078 [Amylostereum chailletii]
MNAFSLFRRYHASSYPCHDPDAHISREELVDNSLRRLTPTFVPTVDSSQTPSSSAARLSDSISLSDLYPFPNRSAFEYADWHWSGGNQKTLKSHNDLMNLFKQSYFNASDVVNAPWAKINKLLVDELPNDPNDGWEDDDTTESGSWKDTPIRFAVPLKSVDEGYVDYDAGTLRHRNLTSVIRDKLLDKSCHRSFHYEPELYTSQAFIDAHQKLQASSPEAGCTLPRVVVGLMCGSDASHLAQFGDAKMWPFYMLYGNESKYIRCKPSSNLCEHVAYFQSAQLRILLDEEFMAAYEHGIVILCPDGIHRRFYPRLFTYSADYPEKCTIPMDEVHMMGSAKDMEDRRRLARHDDQDRRAKVNAVQTLIYQDKYVVNSAAVERILQETSLVPTENAISKCLSQFDIDMFPMFVVDLMHEFELGVWKALFLHLLRILDALKLLPELDRRYRMVPVFGQDTIRKFSKNVSEHYQFAARDYEDILQLMDLLHISGYWHGLAKLRMHTDSTVSIFRNVTRELGEAMRKFQDTICKKYPAKELKREAEARMRREARKAVDKGPADGMACNTMNEVEQTSNLVNTGVASDASNSRLQSSQETSTTTGVWATAATRGLLGVEGGVVDEVAVVGVGAGVGAGMGAGVGVGGARKRCPSETKCSWPWHPKPKDPAALPLKDLWRILAMTPIGKVARLEKSFNLKTYTWHSMGDYADSIVFVGTMDSYTSELIWQRLREAKDVQDDIAREPYTKYNIGQSQNDPIDLAPWLESYTHDPACRDFYPELRAHLLPRIQAAMAREAGQHMEAMLGRLRTNDTTSTHTPSADQVHIKDNRIYEHRVLTANYTTYDVRRAHDVINTGGARTNVMMLAPEDQSEGEGVDDPERFIYARVLGPGMLDYKPRRIDFLWVRYYRRGFSAPGYRMEQVYFPPTTEPGAFGFIDPADVIRGCHIVPAFALGYKHPEGKGTSANTLANDGDDFNTYYHNQHVSLPFEVGVMKANPSLTSFVDRDQVMRRHWGLGVGHTYSHSGAPPRAKVPSNGPPLPTAADPAHGGPTSTSWLDLAKSLPDGGREAVETDDSEEHADGPDVDDENGDCGGGDGEEGVDGVLRALMEFIGTYD